MHLRERRAGIHNQIANIQSRADSVVEMGRLITAKIDEMCNAAKKECNAIIEKKVLILDLFVVDGVGWRRTRVKKTGRRNRSIRRVSKVPARRRLNGVRLNMAFTSNKS